MLAEGGIRRGHGQSTRGRRGVAREKKGQRKAMVPPNRTQRSGVQGYTLGPLWLRRRDTPNMAPCFSFRACPGPDPRPSSLLCSVASRSCVNKQDSADALSFLPTQRTALRPYLVDFGVASLPCSLIFVAAHPIPTSPTPFLPAGLAIDLRNVCATGISTLFTHAPSAPPTSTSTPRPTSTIATATRI